mmetsp:Transcript_29667/g.47786  ORF Transcript_29667/g.47786 Transcript_29667/m.47786 type:complete len:82 (-) Transcript_29667:45-290(-)|eukprot:CAMPEP_0169083816 /NCGR_PEP_ID=MMETSP1015-20121227/12280_1 /TAXON_ID=342587 /ORGANISM="Karlodinium micrum, Strain CCMP2283" /LENGTH=81 /DNA_ID=CAMNT_0009143765 /DNA_START=71 /DNA_END=316 /DNA_ORIENTATION=+
MGAIMSKVNELSQSKKIVSAQKRMKKLVKHAWWLGGHITWTCMTGVIVLAVPVFFEYERECQMFEQMAQMQNAQMNAAPPV